MASYIARRKFLATLGVAAVWPIAARTQQSGKLPTIGFLGAEATAWSAYITAFAERLRALGWIEGRTIAIEYRWSEGRPERVTEIAAEFVRLKVDVIVTNGPAVTTLKQATSVIPIVFAVALDPVGGGLVASLAGRAATSLANRPNSPILPASESNSCVTLFPGSADWQSSLTLTIPQPCWRWARFRPRLARSASKSPHSKFGVRRISLPPSRRSRAKRTRFTSWSMHLLSPISRA
jgi:ABC transporter substrate binding protein